MSTTNPVDRRSAIVALVLLSLAAAVAYYFMVEWKARKLVKHQQQQDKLRAIEDDIALLESKRQELIEKVATFRNETTSAAGIKPTIEEGSMPAYKKQIADLYEKIRSSKEQRAQIKREMSQPPGR